MKLSAQEKSAKTLAPETIAKAAEQVRLNGYVILEDVLPIELIDKLYEAFRGVYQKQYDIDPANTDVNTSAFRKNRARLNMPFENAFVDPDLVANSLILPIFEELLGRDCIINYLAVDAPLPGSDYQVVHADIPPFYPDLGISLPPPGLAMNIPLIDITEENGPTEIWPGGTHLIPENRNNPEYIVETAKLNDPVKVLMSRGSILIRDFRMWHRGTPNNSDSIRPLMAIGFGRFWWRNHFQDTLAVKKDVFESLHDRVKHLARYEKLIEPTDELVVGKTIRRTEQFYTPEDQQRLFKNKM